MKSQTGFSIAARSYLISASLVFLLYLSDCLNRLGDFRWIALLMSTMSKGFAVVTCEAGGWKSGLLHL